MLGDTDAGTQERAAEIRIQQVSPQNTLAVFADATSGNSRYRFRFLRPAAPSEDGSVTVDLNRALLPPCAFADHFICAFPPPGNTLPLAVEAGERNRIDG